MINKIQIKNFKSVYNSQIELGRFNVLIGENGSGKSNILESIVFIGAFLWKKIDNEFLFSRGVRIPEANFFKSAFDSKSQKAPIEFSIWNDDKIVIGNRKINLHDNKWRDPFDIQLQKKGSVEKILKDKTLLKDEKNKEVFELFQRIVKLVESIEDKKEKIETLNNLQKQVRESIYESFRKEKLDELENFLIYSPEIASLRSFSDEGQILPIGIKGEGLFKELKRIFEKRGKKQINSIIQALKLLDWFDDLDIPTTSFSGENKLSISDRYLSEKIQFLDQRNVNEGFLLLLFYLTVVVSEKTPTFIAIDNIDATLNPKLCTQFIKVLNSLSKVYKKRLFLTTHNPFILDGLDLQDNTQRLLVARRDIKGHTVVSRIKPEKPLSFKLSEAWMNGFIGGLPNNF